MANIPEPVNPGFPAVYEIDVDDDVLGGPDGTANLQAVQLVERTAFIKERIVPPGTVIQTFIRSAAVRAQKRLLDLSYQIISITGTYAELAANVYCGDALNATEPWFYKCDASGNRTTSGAYMRLPDPRGLFIRGAGANSVYKGANDTPFMTAGRLRSISVTRSGISRHGFPIEYKTIQKGAGLLHHNLVRPILLWKL